MNLYKIVPQALWAEAQRRGTFVGAPVDIQDGYIHLSTGAQVRETAARHFAGQTDLLLLTIDAEQFGAALRWEPSRGGDLFPHLYAPFPPAAVAQTSDLPLGSDGRHVFPADLP